MKKLMILFFAIFALSCRTASSPASAQFSNINDAIGKNWRLVEVRINNRATDFNRRTLPVGGSEMFTINIDAENISGVGAPNRYSAPYTVSAEDPAAVKIMVLRSTLMASMYQSEKLKEHEFFVYLQNTYKWGLVGSNLELHSINDSGIPVVLIFSL